MNLRIGILFFILLAILCTWLVPLLHPILHYDELSAVTRVVNYPSISKQWEMGIKPDGHPPLLQLIVWLIIQAVGIQPVMLRLIGILFGLWAVWEGYKLALQLILNKKQSIQSRVLIVAHVRALKYTSKSLPVGIITVLFLGVWWWSVSIGYQVRPYSIALPVVLRTWAWAFSSIPTSAKKISFLTVKIASFTVLGAWTHHFAFLSCLSAGFVFLLRFFHSYRRTKSTISLSVQRIVTVGLLFLVIVLIGYIPLFSILQSQLQEGGLSWLGKPQPQFLLRFFADNFHPLLVLLLLLLIVIAIYNRPKTTLILLGAFFVQYLILHIYSVRNKPVLQPSSLYFILPLLFVIADIGWKKTVYFIYYRKFKFGYTLLSISPFLLTMGFLIDSVSLQQWFTLRQKNYHYQFAQQIIRHSNSNRIWFDAEIETIQFHLDKPLSSFANVTCISDCKNPSDIMELLNSLNHNDSVTLCTQAGSQPWLLPYLSSFFRSVSIYSNYIGGQITQFSGFDRNLQQQNPFRCENQSNGSCNSTVDKTLRNCGYKCPIPLVNDTLVYNTSDTINFRYSIALNSIHAKPNDVIVVIAPVEWKSHYSGLIVESTLHNNEYQIDWRGTLFQDFQQPNCNFAIHTIKLSDIPGWNQQTRLGVNIFGAWAWIGIWSGNPYQYGVTPYINDIPQD